MLILGAWYVSLLAIFFVLVCLFMMLVILIQKPRGGGLSGAFGGAGGSAQAAFGAKTGDVLTWFTVVCFTAFLLLAIGLTWSITPVDVTQTPSILPDRSQEDPPAAVAEGDAGVAERQPEAGGESELPVSPSVPQPAQPETDG